MNSRFFLVIFSLLVLVFAVRNTAFADENNNQMSSPMTISLAEQSQSSAGKFRQSPPPFDERLGLNSFEAVAKDDLLLCGNDEVCVKRANRIKGWACMVDGCGRQDKIQALGECAPKFPEMSKEVQGKIISSFCSFIQSPSVLLKRQELLDSFSGFTEEGLVEDFVYVLALTKSAASCKSYIKDYVGPYGPSWRFRWYRALAGCSILSNEIGRRRQENNFSIWYKEGDCAYITDDDLRTACAVNRGVLSFDY